MEAPLMRAGYEAVLNIKEPYMSLIVPLRISVCFSFMIL